jgi:hypothetical protein
MVRLSACLLVVFEDCLCHVGYFFVKGYIKGVTHPQIAVDLMFPNISHESRPRIFFILLNLQSLLGTESLLKLRKVSPLIRLAVSCITARGPRTELTSF